MFWKKLRDRARAKRADRDQRRTESGTGSQTAKRSSFTRLLQRLRIRAPVPPERSSLVPVPSGIFELGGTAVGPGRLPLLGPLGQC